MALLTNFCLSDARQAGTKIFIENFSPLRLTGGGDQFSSVGSQQTILDEESVGNCSLENVKCTSMNEEIVGNFNESSSFRSDLNFENISSDTESVFDGGVPGSDLNSSLLEGDIRDILFEAGYSRESIENVIASRTDMNLDKLLDLAEMSEFDTSLSLILTMHLTC